ncbi:hypothetical protein [Dactylosporangium sp. NPDC051484]|uniref:hypothetical protein n=1 Tax=Dactylosporangium sp. NPDC051484 TaxID=3154942 RepID=UPI00344DA641
MIHQSTPPLDLAAELAELQAARLRRISWRRQANAEHHEARQHGLRFRHAAKLARITANAADGNQPDPEVTA